MAAPVQTALLRFGAFELDVRAGELRKNGARLRLQGQPIEVLRLLVERAGDLVLRDELRQQLWPANTFVDFDHSLNNAVARIREALGDSADAPRFVATVPRRGYKFLVPVDVVPRPSAAESTSAPADAPARRAASRFAAGLAITLLATAAVLLLWRFASARGPYRIAVLPLVNESPQGEGDYLSDGLTDEIIRHLSVIDGLEVKSRTSSFAFKNRPRNIHDIGRELGVDLVLEGSVMRDGRRLRITADLVRVADDVTMWADRYDREMGDVLAIQDEISRSIVNELRLKQIGGKQRYNTNVDAYDLYIRAETLANDYTPGNDPTLRQAVDLFRQAIERQPDFALAYAELADAYANLRNRGQSREAGRQMRDAAHKAIELDPLLPQAYIAMGLSDAADLAWADAEQMFQRALQLDGNLSRGRVEYAIFVLLPEGKVAEALQQVRRAAELDPLSMSDQISVAFVLLTAGRYAQGVDIVNRVLARQPGNSFAGQLRARGLLLLGRARDALPILESEGAPSHGYLGYAYAMVGRRADAERLLAEVDPASARHQVLIYAALGDRERAFHALQQLAADDDFMADIYPGQPELASLRDDPRMKDFRR